MGFHACLYRMPCPRAYHDRIAAPHALSPAAAAAAAAASIACQALTNSPATTAATGTKEAAEQQARALRTLDDASYERERFSLPAEFILDGINNGGAAGVQQRRA